MKTKSIQVPTMYGDHHVLAVRNILLGLPGVANVYASSSFHMVEVEFDAAKITFEQIEAALDEAGYLGELSVPIETAVPATENNGQTYFRHTAAFAQTGNSVGFTQEVEGNGRSLWPCPGIGLIKNEEEPTHG